VPAVRKVALLQTTVLIRGSAFGVNDAQKNLETSLRELGTDYIDFYLLYDHTVGDYLPCALLVFLQDAVKEGKIRNFGLGTDIDNVTRTLGCQLDLCNVLQFQNSLLIRNRERLPPQASQALIISHGAPGDHYRLILSFLNASGERVKDWSAELDLDSSDEAAVAALMLDYGAETNPKSLVLFSSKDSGRITKNTKSVLEPNVSRAQVARFAQLVERNLLELT
jgi:diketogulonate reductase-like aldo/keto reductase